MNQRSATVSVAVTTGDKRTIFFGPVGRRSSHWRLKREREREGLFTTCSEHLRITLRMDEVTDQA